MNRSWIPALAALLSCLSGSAGGDSPYIRVTQPHEQTSRLELAVRTLVPEGAGPLVHLVGAVHIADPSFYQGVQAWLDVHDVVLYEGVGGGWEPTPEQPDAAPALLTDRRLRFIGVLAQQIRAETGQYPASAEELAAAFEGATRGLVDSALLDGWEHPIQIETHDADFDAVSFGADARPGGDGDAADRRLSQLARSKPVTLAPAAQKGLQRDLADALGLEFQLDGIDYSHPHWRNSDLSVEQIRAALAGEPIPPKRKAGPPAGGASTPAPPASGTSGRTDAEKAADVLFGALSGDSLLAKAMGFLVKMMGSSAQGRAMIKLVLADTLCHADAILEAQPGALGELMTVLTVDRNKQVVMDLRKVIEHEPGVRSVAVFYGAGHLPDLEQRICDELGYRYESTTWLPAITVDIAESGLSPEQVRSFREMMNKTIQAQLKRGG